MARRSVVCPLNPKSRRDDVTRLLTLMFQRLVASVEAVAATATATMTDVVVVAMDDETTTMAAPMADATTTVADPVEAVMDLAIGTVTATTNANTVAAATVDQVIAIAKTIVVALTAMPPALRHVVKTAMGAVDVAMIDVASTVDVTTAAMPTLLAMAAVSRMLPVVVDMTNAVRSSKTADSILIVADSAIEGAFADIKLDTKRS
jgi:hypothetical protein